MSETIETKTTELNWKAVGSPARRASVSTEEKLPLPSFDAGIRRKSSVSPPGFENAAVKTIPQIQTPPPTILSLEEYQAIPKNRSRSKSSSAIFGLDQESPFAAQQNIWEAPPQGQNGHRRSSTQPSQEQVMWDAFKKAQLATPDDMNGLYADEMVDRFREEHSVGLGVPENQGVRRFSVAPSMVNRFIARNHVEPVAEHGSPQASVLQVPPQDTRRRHSMAGPAFAHKLNTKFLSEGFEALGLNATKNLEKIDDYFENSANRIKSFQEAGKNLHANPNNIISPILKSADVEEGSTHTWPLFVVEFKAGRTDYFYLPQGVDAQIQVGDLAIVEADRGKDLGKVIETGINSMQELHLYQSTHEDPLVDSHNAIGKEIVPKRLFRLATAQEVATLLQKGEDEEKANQLCQAKIRSKKLPMEVVDAEYQWDRRKLTFYFVSDKRIDFRELVRELFKIYKTRIWMCAVQPREE